MKADIYLKYSEECDDYFYYTSIEGIDQEEIDSILSTRDDIPEYYESVLK